MYFEPFIHIVNRVVSGEIYTAGKFLHCTDGIDKSHICYNADGFAKKKN